MRSEMLGAMAKMGVKVEKHHHEVASAQHELGMKFDTLTLMADQMQIYKYCIHQVAHIYGKTATFMPKPVYGDNGSGMHCHQSIWKDGKPVFAGNKYADLSETCLSYIAGIIKHAKAINAFTNPSTNSYKRLVPGYEAPVLLAYSARNRSASCRIPYTSNPKAKRVEVRFPDPMANPYLGFAAMLMAGLDGIKNKLDPGPAMDKDLYDLPKEELKAIPTVCGSLREALENLDKDRALPQERRRVRRRLHRQLYRAEDDRSRALRNDPASGRIRDVLLAVIGSQDVSTSAKSTENGKAPEMGAFSRPPPANSIIRGRRHEFTRPPEPASALALLAGLYRLAKRLEQRAIDRIALWIVFRMPLHAERKTRRIGDTDRLDGAVFGHALDDNALARLQNALPVQRIDPDRLAAEQLCETRRRA